MIEIEMTKDINARDPKIIWGLTMRQIKCGGIALGYGIPVFLLCPGTAMVRFIVTIVLMMPAFLCAMPPVYGLYLNEFVTKWFKTNIIYPQKRKYVTEKFMDIKADYDIPEKKIVREKDIRGLV